MVNYCLSENPEKLFILRREPMPVCIDVEFFSKEREREGERESALQVF